MQRKNISSYPILCYSKIVFTTLIEYSKKKCIEEDFNETGKLPLSKIEELMELVEEEKKEEEDYDGESYFN